MERCGIDRTRLDSTALHRQNVCVTDPREALGAAIKARRLALNLSVNAAAKAARIDRATWTAAETGTRQTEAYNAGRIERVLGWAAGSIEAILAGGEPTERPEPEPRPEPLSAPEPTLEHEIARLYAMPKLTPRERRAALRALIDFYAEDIDGGSEERPTA